MRRSLGLALVALLVVACSGSSKTAAPSGAVTSPSVGASATAAEPSPSATPTKTPAPTPKPTPSPTPKPTPSPTPALVKPIVTSESIELEGHDKSWKATYKKPVVSGIVAATAGAVNARIGKLVNDRVSQFALDHGEATKTEPSGLDGSYSVAYASPKLLSLRFTISVYISGAAHPITEVDSLAFDLRTGSEISLGSLFTDQNAALGILSTQSRKLLKAELGDMYADDMANPGTEPKAANFEVFALLPSGLEITFGDYQVGPHAIGTPAVVVPWTTLAGVLKPNGPASLVK